MRTVEEIITRKKQGIHADEADLETITRFVADRTLLINSWETKAYEDIHDLFPIQFGEGYDQSLINNGIDAEE